MTDPDHPADAYRSSARTWAIPLHCPTCGDIVDAHVTDDNVRVDGWPGLLWWLHTEDPFVCDSCTRAYQAEVRAWREWQEKMLPPLPLDPDTEMLTAERDSWRDIAAAAERRALAAEARLEAAEARALQLEERIMTLIDKLAAPPAPVSAALGQADVDILSDLAQRHTEMTLTDLLDALKLPHLDHFRALYTTLADAQNAIAKRVVDLGMPVISRRAETKISRNGTLYLSVNFGFNNVSVFNGNVAATFANIRADVSDWAKPGYAIDWHPVIELVMDRDGAGYPRIISVSEVL